MSKKGDFHLKQTWEDKYLSNDCSNLQWIQLAEQSFQKIKQYLPEEKDIQILELGCGTSTLCQVLSDKNNYEKITCIDFSKRLIKRRSNDSKIKFICTDFTQPFKFDAELQYDVIIDKGSIDCVFCQQDYLRKILICMQNIYSRLKVGGKFISISLGQPKNRKYWFRNKLTPFQIKFKKQTNKGRQEWRKENVNYSKDKAQTNEQYFIYVCTKTQDNKKQQSDEGNMSGINLSQEKEQNDKSQQNSSQNQDAKKQQQDAESPEKQNNQEENDNNNNRPQDEQKQVENKSNQNEQQNNSDKEQNKKDQDQQQDDYEQDYDADEGQ